MKTSYYGRIQSKAFKQFEKYGVQISATGRYWSGPKYEPLFPTWDMIHCEDEEKYEKMYREQILDKLDPLEVYNDLGEDAILLCYESYAKCEAGETFCHRHMVARWLEEELEKQYGIIVEIPELVESDIVDLKSAGKAVKKKKKQVEGQMELDL